ncbi:hypothetical protein QCA50_010130 [Cerrena zonata]|uniref:Tyrosine specific protein phosphatases domain-containing protein n=1 Tax=Cerrena zonata TaxID=2478898 RepID=A0AAW0G0I5_9APHY
MGLQMYRGCIALLNDEIDEIAKRFLSSPILQNPPLATTPSSNPFHITLLTKSELQQLREKHTSSQLLERVKADAGPSPHIFPIGLGSASYSGLHAIFVVCICAKLQKFRKKLGLPAKDFHISLSKHDIHDVDKGIGSLLLGELPLDLSPEILDQLVYTLFVKEEYLHAHEYAIKLCVELPNSMKGFVRLGDIASKLHLYKQAMLAFGCAFQRDTSDAPRKYCLQQISVCAEHTEFGTVYLKEEEPQIPVSLRHTLLQPWSYELCSILSESTFTPTLCLESREQMYMPPLYLESRTKEPYRLPRFFRWLVPFHIAFMSTPRNALDIDALASPHFGIRHILTLTEESPLPEKWFQGRNIKNTFLPIPNYHPPTIEQMDLIVRLLLDEANLPMLIHCGGGKGRAGTVAACYLAAFGAAKIPHDTTPTEPAMSASTAISTLRLVRPGSLETTQQEEFVAKWCSTIWKRRSVFPSIVSEPPPCSLEVEGSLKPDSNLFIFVGLPGSGKSWVSQALWTRSPKAWTRVSQDESGGRSTCENVVGRFNGRGRLILNRCNTSANDRKAWLALASHWAVSPVCVWFDYDRDLCTHRAQNRAGHPTLPPGGRVRKAIEQMTDMFVKPSLSEGFTAILRIRSFSAAEEFILRVSPVTLFKFPRTEHLINLGAVTEDDLVSNLSNLSLDSRDHSHVVITEKVDGANMGFSLSEDRSRIVIQNRSHYVNSASHVQFKKLDLWVETHREGLFKVLNRDSYFPQRYILFGEWLAATHSIAYNKLPDLFMAFDLYDRTTAQWADRHTLSSILNDTNIAVVPVLYEGSMLSEAELCAMVQRESHFTDGRLEGVYVKLERDGKVVRRGKIVRGDFITGNEHWTRGQISFNRLVDPTR